MTKQQLQNKHAETYRKKYPERHKAAARRWTLKDRAANPEKYKLKGREMHLASCYGITSADYEAMLKKQRHRCAICRCKEPGGRFNNRWHVDHCHKTKKVRGLLCHRCNLGLGYFHDKVKTVEAAILYLKKSQESPK